MHAILHAHDNVILRQPAVLHLDTVVVSPSDQVLFWSKLTSCYICVQAAYKDVLNRMEEAFEASQRAAAAAQKKASAAVDGVAGAASSVASAAKTSSQQVPL